MWTEDELCNMSLREKDRQLMGPFQRCEYKSKHEPTNSAMGILVVGYHVTPDFTTAVTFTVTSQLSQYRLVVANSG